jgi:hypothetical protein
VLLLSDLFMLLFSFALLERLNKSPAVFVHCHCSTSCRDQAKFLAPFPLGGETQENMPYSCKQQQQQNFTF